MYTAHGRERGSSEEEELVGQLEVVLAVQGLAHQEGQTVGIVARSWHTYCRLQGGRQSGRHRT